MSTTPKPDMTVTNHTFRGPVTETVIAIEYQPDPRGKLRPFQVFTDNGGYDFEYCRRDAETYWHCSSNSRPYLHPVTHAKGTPRCAFWRAPGVAVTNGGRLKGRNLSDATIRRLGYRVLAVPLGNPFDEAQGDTPTIYCERCKDHLPDDCDNPCKHIWWCEKCRHPSTPGNRCAHRRPRS